MTEITDLSTTDSSNTTVTGESIDGAIANMGRMDNTLQAILGLLARSIRTNVLRFLDNADPTKKVALDLSGITTATERTYAAPNKNGTLALTSDVNNTLTPNNLALAATVATNALTIAIKGFDGNDPSASNPVNVPFRSATANSGDVDVLTLTAATSLVVSSGSTLGTTSSLPATLVVGGFNDAGTFRLAVQNPMVLPVKNGIASSTAEGGAGAADSAGVWYTGTAVVSKPVTVLGFINITEATAGTWATAPTVVQVGDAPNTSLQTGRLSLGATATTTSGTAHNWTGIPEGTKRITVSFAGTSLSGTADYLIRIGSGSVDTTGYVSGWGIAVSGGASNGALSTAGFIIAGSAAVNVVQGAFTLTLVDASTNTWVSSGAFALSNTAAGGSAGGTKSLSGVLDRVQVTTTNGTDTFDAGKINVLYEQ